MTKAHWIRIPFLIVAVLAAGSARANLVSPVASLGDNTYRITVKAGTKFTRNTAKLKDQAIEEATRFCAKEGKQLKVVKVDESKSMYLVGPFAEVTLTFKPLAPGDPELSAQIESHGKPVVIAPAPMNADLLTSELTKLDELRKKGLLTDEEFTTAKRKLLERM